MSNQDGEHKQKVLPPIALAQAIHDNDVESAKRLIEKWKDIADSIYKNETLLMLAIDNGRTEIVEIMLQFKPDPYRRCSVNKETYLHRVVRTGNMEMLKLFRKDPVWNPLLLTEDLSHKQDIFRMCVDPGFKHIPAGPMLDPLLEWLSVDRPAGAVGAFLDSQNRSGHCFMHQVCQGSTDQTELLKILVKWGSKGSNVRNTVGESPLHCAILSQQVEMVRYLVQVDPIATLSTNKYGNTPLHKAGLSLQPNFPMAVRTQMIQILLWGRVAPLYWRNHEGYMPLEQALYTDNQYSLVLYLQIDPSLFDRILPRRYPLMECGKILDAVSGTTTDSEWNLEIHVSIRQRIYFEISLTKRLLYFLPFAEDRVLH